MVGTLKIGGVDIGNINDISPRMIEGILSSDIIIVESVQRFNDKCLSLSISPKAIIVENDSINQNNLELLVFIKKKLLENKNILLTCSDGMPSICDPGYMIVQSALSVNAKVSVIPGPSIVSTLPALSGFNNSSFIFQETISPNQIVRHRELTIAKESGRAFLFVIPERQTQNKIFLDILNDINLVYGEKIQVAVGVNITGIDEFLCVGSILHVINIMSDYTIDHTSNVSIFIDKRI